MIDDNADMPQLKPILITSPSLSPSPSPTTKEETIWKKAPTIEGMTQINGMDAVNTLYTNITQYISAVSGGDDYGIDKCSLSFNGILQEKLNYLAEKYVALFSFSDYKNATIENQTKKASDIQHISRQMFSIALLPICFFFTYNWFFLLCYTNKVNIPVEVITETPYYTYLVDTLNMEPNFIKPVLLYFFEFPLKSVLNVDYFLMQFLRDKINATVPNNMYIFVFYALYWILYSLDNKFCDFITGDNQDGGDIEEADGENDLCGYKLENPYSNPFSSSGPPKEDPCTEYKKCSNMIFDYIKMLSIIAIVFYWIQSIFGVFALSPQTMMNLVRLFTTPFPFNIIILIVICLIFILRLVANLWDYFIDLSAYSIILYGFIYSCMILIIKIGIYDIGSIITAMDDFMASGNTDGTKNIPSELDEENIDKKIIHMIRLFISNDKLSLLFLITCMYEFINTFKNIESYHLRLMTGIFFAISIIATSSYKFCRVRKNMQNL